VLTGIALAEDLSPHADVVLPDIGGLPGWLDSLATARSVPGAAHDAKAT
jgi:phosphoglycolate phosphatase